MSVGRDKGTFTTGDMTIDRTEDGGLAVFVLSKHRIERASLTNGQVEELKAWLGCSPDEGSTRSRIEEAEAVAHDEDLQVAQSTIGESDHFMQALTGKMHRSKACRSRPGDPDEE